MKALVAIACAAGLLLALGSGAQAATGTYESPGPSVVVRASGPVWYVSVGVRVQAAAPGSPVGLTLVAPNGRTVTLSSPRAGGWGTGTGCNGSLSVFADDGFVPLAKGTPPYTDNFVPQSRLAALDGVEARGRWSLRTDGGAARISCLRLVVSRNVPETKTQRAGGTEARLSYRERNFQYRDVRLAIARRGRTLVDVPLAQACGDNCGLPYEKFLGRPLTVRDLDGNGEPDVMLDLFTGGAHCCFVSLVYAFDPAKQTYRKVFADWANSGYVLRDLDKDGHVEFVSNDNSFAYEFTAYVSSGLPVQVFRLQAGRFVDVTRSYPALIGEDAASNLEGARAAAKDGSDPRGLLAAYVADECLLGHCEVGFKEVDAALARGDLSGEAVAPEWPTGRAYVTALRAFLRKQGYLAGTPA